jgi:hypothetical protein
MGLEFQNMNKFLIGKKFELKVLRNGTNFQNGTKKSRTNLTQYIKIALIL